MVGRQAEILLYLREKNRGAAGITTAAPRTPVNGAGGITGCTNDARPWRSFQPAIAFFAFFCLEGVVQETFVVWPALVITNGLRPRGIAKCHGF